MPWKELVQICKEEGIWSVVDAAHSIGQENDINLGEAKPDFWVSVSGYGQVLLLQHGNFTDVHACFRTAINGSSRSEDAPCCTSLNGNLRQSDLRGK